MYVETWGNFIQLLQTVAPMLSPILQKRVSQLVNWAGDLPNTHHGLDQSEIDYVVDFLDDIVGVIPAEWAVNVKHGQYFLRSLNDGPNADWIEHESACIWWGYFWYNNSCHVDDRVIKLVCKDRKTKALCLDSNCYWYNNACHASPPPVVVVECEDWKIEEQCLTAGCYWWNSSCHSYPEPPPDEPPPDEPPPTVVKCSDHINEPACLTAGCYWWEGSCHGEPEIITPGESNPVREFAKQVNEYCATIPLTRPLEILNCGILCAILKITADVFDFLGKKK